MSRTIWLLMVLVFALGLAGCSPPDTAAPPTNTPVSIDPTLDPTALYSPEHPARILRLSSYHEDYLWDIQINEGMLRGFAEQGYSEEAGNLSVDYFYMDTKRNTGTEYFEQIAEETIAYIRETQPDLIIASDNNAIRLVVSPLAQEGFRFVFNGLNDAPETYNLADLPNVTGVLERAHVQETLAWIERVLPEATHITCILDDSITTAAYVHEVEAAIAASRFAGSPILITNAYEEWQEYVLAATEDSDAIMIGTYHTLRDASNTPVHEDTVMDWMVENSTIPIVPFWEFSVQRGALGGSVLSGDTQGYESALLAAQILDGAEPGSLPIVTPQRGRLVLNRAAIDRWGVTIPLDLQSISTIYAE